MKTVEITKENIDEKGNVMCPDCGQLSPMIDIPKVENKKLLIKCECNAHGEFLAITTLSK